MTTAVRPRAFATAGDYPAGPDDWSGMPRVVDLTDGERADGFVPDTPVPPEVLNGLFAQQSAAESVLALRAAQEWGREDLPVGQSGKDCTFSFLVGARLPGVRERLPVAVGSDANNSDLLVHQRGASGRFEDFVNDTLVVGPRSACAGAPGELLTSDPSNLHVFTSLGLANDVKAAAATCVHYAPGSPTPYIAALNDGSFYVGATFLGMSSVPGPPGASAFAVSALGDPGGEFADDGGLNVVYAGSSTVSGTTRLRIVSSSDGGATWAVRATQSSAALSLGVQWCPALGVFVAVCEFAAGSVSVQTSQDGVSWTVVGTALSFPSGLSTAHRTVAVAGHCVAKAFSPTVYSRTLGGVSYSFDLGSSWRHVLLDVNNAVTALSAVNGRLYAVSGAGHVYRSGVLATEGADV